MCIKTINSRVLATPFSLLVLLTWLMLSQICNAEPPASQDTPESQTKQSQNKPKKTAAWRPLFDGKKLGKWKTLNKGEFEDHGAVEIKQGALQLGKGVFATGVRFDGLFPSTNYELQWEARRIAGGDFFCGLTFPVKDGSLTLVLGGWGGWVVGLSCINGQYAIDNDTVTSIRFKNDRWYAFHLRVEGNDVTVIHDKQALVEFKHEGQKLTVSPEMKPCAPLGIASWKTGGQIRKIRYRPLAVD